jgi:putative component of toxin-antitoxin plasmid stabilization module
MIEVRQAAFFAKWLSGLRDRVVRARIEVRIDRMALGNPGDVIAVGGGDKKSQARDIAAAKAIAAALECE